jgi:uncharacterized membrane protein YgcG
MDYSILLLRSISFFFVIYIILFIFGIVLFDLTIFLTIYFILKVVYAIYLIYRYNSFRKFYVNTTPIFEFTEFDRKIIYSSALYIFAFSFAEIYAFIRIKSLENFIHLTSGFGNSFGSGSGSGFGSGSGSGSDSGSDFAGTHGTKIMLNYLRDKINTTFKV